MIFRNSMLLAFFSGVSLLLGIFRDRLLAQIVGVGPMLDVYNASFRIPDLVYGVFFAVVSAQTVVPFITRHIEDKENDVEGKFNSLFFFFGFTLTVLAIILMIALPFIAPFIVPGFDEFQIHYFTVCSMVLMIQPLFLGLSALVSSLAQVKHRFVLYSVAPLVYTLTIIASIIFLYRPYGVVGVTCGVVAGAVLSFIVQSYTLYQERMKLRMSLFSWGYVKAHLRVSIPRSLSTVVSRLRDLIYASIATTLGVGVLSIYLFAQRIIDAFIQVVVQSAATATLPLLAHKHAHGEHKDFTAILKINLISIFSISLIVSIIIIFLSDKIVHLLYGNVGRIGEIARMAKYFAFALPIYAVNNYFVNTFSAKKDTMGLFYANLGATVIGVMALLLGRHFDQGMFSLALALWSATFVYLLLLIGLYSRKRKITH